MYIILKNYMKYLLKRKSKNIKTLMCERFFLILNNVISYVFYLRIRKLILFKTY
jgi:hypothetical protein